MRFLLLAAVSAVVACGASSPLASSQPLQSTDAGLGSVHVDPTDTITIESEGASSGCGTPFYSPTRRYVADLGAASLTYTVDEACADGGVTTTKNVHLTDADRDAIVSLGNAMQLVSHVGCGADEPPLRVTVKHLGTSTTWPVVDGQAAHCNDGVASIDIDAPGYRALASEIDSLLQ